jgi:hypothetical protein
MSKVLDVIKNLVNEKKIAADVAEVIEAAVKKADSANDNLSGKVGDLCDKVESLCDKIEANATSTDSTK